MWKREEWPTDIEDDKRWPVRLMHVGRRGDELWWYDSPPETWEQLCGRAGWALVRAGRVIDVELVMMN